MKILFLKHGMAIANFCGFRKMGFRIGLLLLTSSAFAVSCSGNQTRCYEAADTPVDTVEHTCYKPYVPIDSTPKTDSINLEEQK